jgi:hypothetical protein
VAGIYLKRSWHLVPAGLIDNTIDAAAAIDSGRKGFAIRGKAEEGRISYEWGISQAISAFKDASTFGSHLQLILM